GPEWARAQAPVPAIVESPNVKILKGLIVPVFEDEMRLMVQGLGVSCNFCHPRDNFASEDNAYKLTARRMLEMTKAINQQFFPDYKPQDGDSVLGKVTCYACHKGEQKPKLGPG
ncbi:MAG: c-type cytochrome, partial [Bryobacteraceae bacterium]